jgi:TRAP-type mannitol/chloroaromatic compound transport system permease small subunit
VASSSSWIKACETVSEWSGRAVAWLTLVMVVVTFAVVVLRYAFGMGWIAMQESVLWMHGIVFMLGAAYTLKHDGHVRVDVFYRDASDRARAWTDLLGTVLLLLPLCAFILWASWGYVGDSWAMREQSREAGGLPALYLLKTVIPAAAVLLAVQAAAIAGRCVVILRGKPR